MTDADYKELDELVDRLNALLLRTGLSPVPYAPRPVAR